MEMRIPEGYKQTEIGMIPEDWGVEGITKYCQEIFLGLTSKVDYVNHGGVPLIRATDISNGRLSFQNALFISNQQHKQLTKYRKAKLGDILVSKSGSLGVCALVDTEKNFSIYESIIVLQPIKNKLNSRFFLYILRFQGTQKRLLGETVGSTVGHLNLNDFKQLEIPLPPLPEQKAIAQALSDADVAIAELDRLITKKRNIKQGAMQQLLTGKKRLPGFSGEWEEKRLEEIVEIDSDNLKSDTSPNYSFNYISLEDVEQGKLKNFCHCIFSCAPSRARRRVRKNDILVATVRPNLKSHFFVRFEMEDFICSTGFAVVRCNPSEICAEYIYYHFFANVIEQQLYTLLVGSNYPAVNSRDIKNLKIPLPSFDEQKAIAQILSDIDAEIEALEQKRDKYKAIKQGMMQELLTGRTRLV